jgi:16S rRNA (guanine527-N7)-methyltransferase
MDIHLSAEKRKVLHDALGEAQRIGMLGSGALETVIERSLGFVRRLPDDTRTVIDLGSGGGDPGLVIATGCPNLIITLVDRRAKRTDLLVRLVGRLGLSDRVEVIEADVADLPRRYPNRTWDIVSSRGFGSPAYTATHAAPLIRVGGSLLVSEPPESTGDRWRCSDVESQGLVLDSVEFGVARLIRTTTSVLQ